MSTTTNTASTSTSTAARKTVHAEVGKGVTNRSKARGKDKNPPTDKRIVAERETRIDKRKGEPTEPREESKRGQLLGMLRKGSVTLGSIAKKFDWKDRDVMDAARLLARVNGFAIKVADGKMSLIRH